MRNAHLFYQCYPSVVCVGKETEVTIFPRDISRRFMDSKEYELAVVGLQEDQLDYHSHVALDHPCRVENGCLKFTYFFDMEQEYSIRFAEKGGKEIKIPLYAVEQDLYELRPLKGDLHSHTYYSDGTDGIAMAPANYREEGFDFVAITDHNRMYPSQLATELYEGVNIGLHLMTGEEVHTPGSLVHIVHAGGKESVCDRYVRDRATFEAEVEKIAETLTHIPEQYRDRVAMAHWTCQKIHEAEGLAIYAHPYWCPNRYNESKELGNLMFSEKIYDAFELVGGAPVNPQLAIWQDFAMQGNRLPVVGSSDSHCHDYAQRKSFARRFTIVFAKDNTTEAILDAIRKGYSLAAEIPADSDNDIHLYGAPVRLVLFAKFIWDHYFNETWRLCVGEGILMRRYAEGEDVADLLNATASTVENFYKKFYGLAPAPTMNPARSAFLDRCLKVQREIGPTTKGSNLYIYGGNERRE